MRLLAATLAAVALNVGTASATEPLYINLGTLTNAPQIDATAFVNLGQFVVGNNPYMLAPYQTQNTLYYTNHGTLIAYLGFNFDTVDDAGIHRPALAFHNGPAGLVGVSDGIIEFPKLQINAEQVQNRGMLEVTAGGLLRIDGTDVDLRRSGLGIDPLVGRGSPMYLNPNAPGFGTFDPEIGIFDIYWGLSYAQDPALDSGRLLSFVGPTIVVNTGAYPITNSTGDGADSLFLSSPSSYVYTNETTPTNWVIQAVFVSTRDTNLTKSVSFYDSTIPTNEFKSVVVQLASQETNVVTGGNYYSSIYLLNTIASETNFLLLTNSATGSSYRPSPFVVARIDPFFGGGSAVTNAVVTTNLFYDTTYSNRVVTNMYAAYACQVRSLPTSVPLVPGSSITNNPGRIELAGQNLNLERTRIRGEGLVRIDTPNLLSTSNTAIDVQNLFFNLGAANGDLVVKNLSQKEVQRMNGSIYAYSAVWTNFTGSTVTNEVEDPPGSGTLTNQVTTNVIEIAYAVLVVDAALINTRLDVQVSGLRAESTNVNLGDFMRINESIEVRAQGLTVDGTLLMSDRIHDWGDAYFPGLRFLTNNGIIAVPGTGFYGSDGNANYEVMVNRGTNIAFGHKIKATYYEGGGLTVAGASAEGATEILWGVGSGTISLETQFGKLENGRFLAGGDIELAGANIKFHAFTNQTDNRIYLKVTDSLADSGAGARNVIVVPRGVHLVTKPQLGDLLGTRIVVQTPQFEAVEHEWAAEDRGVSADGFKNNAAVGTLVLDGQPDSYNVFKGMGTNNAIYVDYLEIGPNYIEQLDQVVSIAPNLTIYYAFANMPVEELDGALGGRLRWVSQFAGPNSTVFVRLRSGQTIKVNRGLRESTVIDSDGDGLANGYDLDPFDFIIKSLTVQQADPSQAFLTWSAAAGQVYQVEYTTDLFEGSWQVLTEYHNTATTNGPVTIQDVLPADSAQRYYRVRFTP